MPFVRFSRDRRGYEHVYLVHAPVRRGKPSRPRVLYWYRSPPGVKVGREAFDAGVRQALEAQYPDLTFDWETLAAPPPPAPAIEPWRERRRLQKIRRSRTAESEVDVETTPDDPSESTPEPLATDIELLAGPSAEEPAERAVAVETPEGERGTTPTARKSRRRRRRGGSSSL